MVKTKPTEDSTSASTDQANADLQLQNAVEGTEDDCCIPE